MLRTMAVIMIPIVLITIFFSRNLGDHPVTVIDWQPVYVQAKDEAPFTVLAPHKLPENYRATRVTWVKVGQRYLDDPSVRNLWQLGFLDPEDIYIGLSQGDLYPDDLVADASRGGMPDGSSVIAGVTWDRLVTADDRTRSLVLRTPDVTTVVAGDTSYAGLEAFASTLT